MGTISHADLISTYDSRFQLERGHDTVPFRLTRNMQSFIGPQGMEGMVVCAITAAAQALHTEPGITSSVVALFFRSVQCSFQHSVFRSSLCLPFATYNPHCSLRACSAAYASSTVSSIECNRYA